MKRNSVFLFAFAVVENLLAALAVLRGYASVQIAGAAVMVGFALMVTLLMWWGGTQDREEPSKTSKTTKVVPIWLLASFAASACVAIIQGIHEGWDIGDTIGLGFFLLFAGLSVYEAVRKRQVNKR